MSGETTESRRCWMPRAPLPGCLSGDEPARLEGLAGEVEEKSGDAPLHTVIEEFRALIDRDPVVRMYLTQMIEQVPHTKKYRKRHLKDVAQMLRLIDAVISSTSGARCGRASRQAAPSSI